MCSAERGRAAALRLTARRKGTVGQHYRPGRQNKGHPGICKECHNTYPLQKDLTRRWPKSIQCTLLQLHRSAANSCSRQGGEDGRCRTGQEEWQHVETRVLKDGEVFKTKRCFPVNLPRELCAMGTITIPVPQMTLIRPREFFTF